jgi:hypothetical protein
VKKISKTDPQGRQTSFKIPTAKEHIKVVHKEKSKAPKKEKVAEKEFAS